MDPHDLAHRADALGRIKGKDATACFMVPLAIALAFMESTHPDERTPRKILDLAQTVFERAVRGSENVPESVVTDTLRLQHDFRRYLEWASSPNTSRPLPPRSTDSPAP